MSETQAKESTKLDWSRLLGFDQVGESRQQGTKLNAPRFAKIGGKTGGKTVGKTK